MPLLIIVIFLNELSCRMRWKSVSLLSSTLESSTDGILVVNPEGKLQFTIKIAEMWRIPEPILSSHNDEQALAFVLSQLKYPDEFLTKVKMLVF